jgi:SAM-dependent methyltransferase
VSSADPRFSPAGPCWICGAAGLRPVARAIFELSIYAAQDPELAGYSGATVELLRCAACGFGQPAALPALPGYFARMYDQRWSRAWMEEEYRSGTKDLVFREALSGLERRLGPGRRRLLDLGAHVGRLVGIASARGWGAEGVELNPATAAFAAEVTGATIHREDAGSVAAGGRRFDAVTLVDVLEHIPRPVEALRAARGVLDAGGWLAVKVPHGPNQLLKERIRAAVSPRYRATVADNLVHVSHFTPRSLCAALARAGFDRIRVAAAPPVLPPRGGWRARTRSAMLRSVAAAARTIPGGERTPLAMNLQAYARTASD